MDNEINHALILPWSLSSGMPRTWCGNVDPGQMVATDPEHMNCEHCKRAMETAHKNLSEWLEKIE